MNDDLFIHYMGDIERNGTIKQYDYVDIKPDDYLTIIYTSGSSGFPKGVIRSEAAFRATFPRWCLPALQEFVTFAYRPLAWASDRDAIIATFLSGGQVGFSTGDPARLMEELALVRPTYFSAPPTIWNKIYTEFKHHFSTNYNSMFTGLHPRGRTTSSATVFKSYTKSMSNNYHR